MPRVKLPAARRRGEFWCCPVDGCNWSSKVRTSYSRHYTSRHTVSYKFVCDQCGAGHYRQDNLRRHMATCQGSQRANIEKRGRRPSFAIRGVRQALPVAEEEERQEMMDVIRGLEEEKDRWREERREMEDVIREMEEERFRWREEMQEMVENIRGLEEEKVRLNKMREVLEEDKTLLMNEKEALERENHRLQQWREELEENNNSSRALQEVINYNKYILSPSI